MEKPRILYVSQEIFPYTDETHMSKMARFLPQGIQERGNEIRTFMPRYGSINERRNQLHEVIRLSGLNLNINDVDHPLIIKVASIQSARMQIYFIDNEEFFHKKSMHYDKQGVFYEDNDEKAIFFARGVLETVKKLSWTPDVIHCSGWFSAMLPLYVKKVYRDNPVFSGAKIVTSLFSKGFEGALSSDVASKLAYDGMGEDVTGAYGSFTYTELMRLAADYSDGLLFADAEVGSLDWARNLVAETGKPLLEYMDGDGYTNSVNEFYKQFITK